MMMSNPPQNPPETQERFPQALPSQQAAPPQAPPPAVYQAPPPAQYSPPPPPPFSPPPTEYTPLFRPSTAPYPVLVKNSMLVIMVVVSILTIFIGATMVHSAPMITNKKYDGNDAQTEREADQRTAVTVTNVGHILADVGAFLLILILLLAGMLRTDWSDYVRFGVLFFVAVFAFALGFRV